MRDSQLIDHRKDAALLVIATSIAEQATCKRARVGALIVEPSSYRILSTGYNGSPRGMPHCTDVGCDMRDGHCERCEHAELNALLNAAAVGVAVAGGWAFVTHRPCWRCSRAIVQAGLHGVVYAIEYGPEDDRMDLLKHQTGLTVRRASAVALQKLGVSV